MNRKALIALLVLIVGAGAALAQAPPLKIGVFDADRVMNETEEGKRVQVKLTAFRDKKAGEIAAKEKEVAELNNRLQTQALSLSPDARSALEKDVQKKALEVNQARESAQRELQMEVADAQNAFQQQFLQVVEQFGNEEGFTLIFEKSFAAFASKSVEVTTALVERFNRIYPAKPAAAPAESRPPEPAKDTGKDKK